MPAPTYDYYGQGELDQGSREEDIEDDEEDEEEEEEEVSQRPELGARVHVQFGGRGLSSETSRAFCLLSRASLLVATISCHLLLL